MISKHSIKQFLRLRFPETYFALKVSLVGMDEAQTASCDRFLNCLPTELRYKYQGIVRRVFDVVDWVDCQHTYDELFEVISAIAKVRESTNGVVVEAGCFKGGSAAKLSHACAVASRELVLFDSFEGIPSNEEPHEKNIFGGRAYFKVGAYAGSLEEVRKNIRHFGRLEVCTFKRGWFDDTMPDFNSPITVAYVDVDLASSTRTCMKYLYPLLVPGGVIFSQDGHLPLVIEVLKDESFWRDEVGVPMPRMTGLEAKKLVGIYKD